MQHSVELQQLFKGYWILILFASGFVVSSVGLFLNPSAFIADDSYFYLVISQNLANGNGATFDTLYTTNGFHPLWAIVLAMFLYIIPTTKAGIIVIVCILHVILSLSTLLVLWRAIRDFKAPSSVTYIALLPPFFLLLSTGVVGSEAAVSALCLSVLLFFALRLLNQTTPPTTASAILLGVLIALCFLARLDNILLFTPFGVFVIIQFGLRFALIVGLTALVGVAPYLIWNHVMFSSILPIHGSLKSSFPYLSNQYIGNTHPIHLLLILCIVTQVIYLFIMKARQRYFVLAIGAGAVIQYAYHYVFQIAAAWFWYSIMPSIVLSILLGMSVAETLKESSLRWRTRWVVFIHISASALLGASTAVAIKKAFFDAKQQEHQVAMDVWKIIPEGDSLLIGDWQGILQFYGDGPVICLNGLTDNAEYATEIRSGSIAEFIEANEIGWFLEERGEPTMSCRDVERADAAASARECVLYYGLAERHRIPGRLKLERRQRVLESGPRHILWQLRSVEEEQGTVGREKDG